jgi:hypothetical protein
MTVLLVAPAIYSRAGLAWHDIADWSDSGQGQHSTYEFALWATFLAVLGWGGEAVC